MYRTVDARCDGYELGGGRAHASAFTLFDVKVGRVRQAVDSRVCVFSSFDPSRDSSVPELGVLTDEVIGKFVFAV